MKDIKKSLLDLLVKQEEISSPLKAGDMFDRNYQDGSAKNQILKQILIKGSQEELEILDEQFVTQEQFHHEIKEYSSQEFLQVVQILKQLKILSKKFLDIYFSSPQTLENLNIINNSTLIKTHQNLTRLIFFYQFLNCWENNCQEEFINQYNEDIQMAFESLDILKIGSFITTFVKTLNQIEDPSTQLQMTLYFFDFKEGLFGYFLSQSKDIINKNLIEDMCNQIDFMDKKIACMNLMGLLIILRKHSQIIKLIKKNLFQISPQIIKKIFLKFDNQYIEDYVQIMELISPYIYERDYLINEIVNFVSLVYTQSDQMNQLEKYFKIISSQFEDKEEIIIDIVFNDLKEKNQILEYQKLLDIIEEQNFTVQGKYFDGLISLYIDQKDFQKVIDLSLKKIKLQLPLNLNLLAKICSFLREHPMPLEQIDVFYKDIIIPQIDQLIGNFKMQNFLLTLLLKYDILNDYYLQIEQINEQMDCTQVNLKVLYYIKQNKHEYAYKYFMKIPKDIQLVEFQATKLIEYFSTTGDYKRIQKLYQKCLIHQTQMYSVDFLNILKCYVKNQMYKEGLEFFNSIRENRYDDDMILTFNFALNIYNNIKQPADAEILFQEIESNLKVDMVSYATIIKILVLNNQQQKAFQYYKKMIESNYKKFTASTLNQLLESTANNTQWKFSLEMYQYAIENDCDIDEITFGTIVKNYAFNKQLDQAFELLNVMKQKNITPSIVYFTNLIHISYGMRNWQQAIEAFQMVDKLGIEKDSFIFVKLLNGLLKCRKYQYVEKFMKQAIKERCGFKEEYIEFLRESLNGPKFTSLINELSEIPVKNLKQYFDQEKKAKLENMKKHRTKLTTNKFENRRKTDYDISLVSNRSTQKQQVTGHFDGETKNAISAFRRKQVKSQ